MKAPRICVKCKEPLGRQLRSHMTKKKLRAPYGVFTNWCDGPRKTPGGGRAVPQKAIHFRYYASTTGNSLCGLRGGRMSGKYKDPGAQVPWSRLNVKLEQTTCEECLAMIFVAIQARLAARLAKVGGTLDAALDRARTRLTMNGVESLVSA